MTGAESWVSVMSLTRKTFVLSDDVSFECLILVIRRADGELEFWFKARDVAAFLEYGDPDQAVRRNVRPEWKKKWSEFAILGNFRGRQNLHPQTVFVSEAGLYALVNRSRKPEAVRFQDWVNSVVLPALRRRGAYYLAGNDDGRVVDREDVLDLLGHVSVQVAEIESERSPMSDEAATRHTFVLFSRPTATDGSKTEYRAIRCQERNLEDSLARIEDLGTYDRVLHCGNVPNSINVLVRAKEMLRCEGLSYSAWGVNKIAPSDPRRFEQIVSAILEGDHGLSMSLASGEALNPAIIG